MSDQQRLPPEKLYRYRSMAVKNEAWVREIFMKCEQYFARPKDLNDPFDSRVNLRASTRNQNERYFEKIIKQRAIAQTKRERRKMVKEYLDNVDSDQIRETYLEAFETIRETIGVLCLSEINDDILMWSHYTGGHKGFCLEYDSKVLPRISTGPFRVNYSKEYPILNIAKTHKSDYAKIILLTKSDHWRYECEYRLILIPNLNGNPGNNKFRPHALTGVIFGCEMSNDDKRKIKGWIAEGPTTPKLSQAVKKEREFGLDIVDYDPKIHDK